MKRKFRFKECDLYMRPVTPRWELVTYYAVNVKGKYFKYKIPQHQSTAELNTQISRPQGQPNFSNGSD